MLINDQFIFLQLQKTGGTHMELLIGENFPNTLKGGKHFRLSKNFDIKNRNILGAIRNPWEWYLSYWTYSCMNKGGPHYQCCKKKSLLKFFTNGRKFNCNKEVAYSFYDFINCTKAELCRPINEWKYLYEDATDPKRFREWLKLVLSNERRFDLFQDYGISKISQVSGIYTYLFLFLYAENINDLFNKSMTLEELYNINININGVVKTENLNEDFIRILNILKIPYDKRLIKNIENIMKTNTSNRKHPISKYYDEASVNLVAEKESYLIKQFDYKFNAE